MRIRWLVFVVAASIAGAGAAAAPAPPGDLDGVWTNATATPLQRPKAFDGPTTDEAHAAAYEEASVAGFLGEQDAVGSRQSEWFELGSRMGRIRGKIPTSILIDPPDGQLPYSDVGRRLLKAAQDAVDNSFDGPEVRPAAERCLAAVRGSSSVPMFPPAYNGNFQIVQTADHVAIWMEMGAAPRIIRLNTSKHLPVDVRPWMGDSIGHWQGHTLVVDTTNLNPGEAFKMPSPIYISAEAKVTERFTRISPGEILYEFTVDDPKVFTRPWRGEQLLTAAKGPMYEYACHEGNYSLPGALAGARQTETAVR